MFAPIRFACSLKFGIEICGVRFFKNKTTHSRAGDVIKSVEGPLVLAGVLSTRGHK